MVSKLLVCLPNSLSFSNHMTLPNFHHHCYGVISELGHISTFCNSPIFAWLYVSFLAPYIKDIKEETGQSLATQPLNLFWVNTMFSFSYYCLQNYNIFYLNLLFFFNNLSTSSAIIAGFPLRLESQNLGGILPNLLNGVVHGALFIKVYFLFTFL